MSDIITVNNLSKRYGKNVVLDNLSFSLPRGRVIGLLGENGVGKTTLLRLMADIVKPDGGEILIDGRRVSRETRDRVSYLLEPRHFYSFMKVKDALQYHRDFYGDFDYGKALGLCQEFRLGLSRWIDIMSRGNRERLCLLLCLSRKVPLYLLDEPMAGFDPKFKRDIVKTILSNIEPDATMIIASHLLRDLQSVFDDIVILRRDGVVMAAAEDIRARGKSVEDFYMEASEK